MSVGAPVLTRERLLEAARASVEASGYRGASVAAIAARAGLATGTLYRHFPSKEALFVELFRAVCGAEERAMRAAGAASPPSAGALARLEAILGTFADRALRNPRLAWALLAEPVDPLVDAERLAFRGRYAGLVRAELESARAAGEIPVQDVDLVAAALVGGCGEALVGPLSPAGGAPTPQARAALVTALRRWVRQAAGGASSPGRPPRPAGPPPGPR